MVVSNMVQEIYSEEFNHEVKADKDHSQILIKITPSSKSYVEAKKIIEELGINILETKYLSPNQILLELDAKDMRVAALKLTENGFSEIKGYNASSFEI
jgi:hypothetical protein